MKVLMGWICLHFRQMGSLLLEPGCAIKAQPQNIITMLSVSPSCNTVSYIMASYTLGQLWLLHVARAECP